MPNVAAIVGGGAAGLGLAAVAGAVLLYFGLLDADLKLTR
jgi:predicted flavoprotein YhiN